MSEEEEKKGRIWRPFPKHLLQESLKIAQAIHDKNNDKPMQPMFVAEAIGRKPDSSEFRLLLSSSLRYGLTKGSYASEYIELTPLASSITKPVDPQQKIAGLQEAAQKPEVFGKVYDYYRNGKFPGTDEFFKNKLEVEFGVPREFVNECIQLLYENGKFVGIIRDVMGSPRVVFEEFQSPQEPHAPTPRLLTPETPTQMPTPTPTPPAIPQLVVQRPRVFISHSKNQKILTQIERILQFGQFDHDIAEKTETTAIPIPDKVFGSMRKCNCAIINISADEQEKRDDGSYGINQNVLIEIGAAFLLYNKRVILLTDKRITMPSNLKGLYNCYYEGDELGFESIMKLQEALLNFRNMD